MMYSVTWTLDAVTMSAALESQADDPSRIAGDSARIDYVLRRTPNDVGESREPGGFRLWYADVVGVYYHVDMVAMKVVVLSVAPTRRR